MICIGCGEVLVRDGWEWLDSWGSYECTSGLAVGAAHVPVVPTDEAKS